MLLREQQSCPICKASQRRFLGLRGDRPIPALLRGEDPSAIFSIYRCTCCQHTYCDPLPATADLTELYEDAEDYFHGADTGRVRAAEEFLSLIEAYQTPGRLLDVGCGEGHLLEAARSRGWEAIGVEPTPAFAARAADRGFEVHNVYLDSDFTADAPFDVVTATAVLEHVADPVAVLLEANRLLKPSGVVLFEVPNGQRLDAWLLDRLLRLQGTRWTVRTAPMQEPFHLSEFSRASAAAATEVAGFSVIDIQTKAGRVPYPLPAAMGFLVRSVEVLGNSLGRGLNIVVVGAKS